jgi:HAMP domain-containing protein
VTLLTKFSLLFTVAAGTGLAVAGYLTHGYLQQNAREEVIQQARLMMETSRASRTYTSQQIQPLLKSVQDRDNVFLPQTVPGYAATESFNYLRKTYPNYTYKEATLNPTNLRDRAVDWEADIVSNFRDNPSIKESSGERESPLGPSLFFARPIIADAPCLECHSTPRVAPAAMIRRYGSANGFGWKQGETIGAQIVSVPMSVPINMAEGTFRTILAYMAGTFVVTLLVLNFVIALNVARPVSKLSQVADQISQGNLEISGSQLGGSREISMLAASFERMRLSLVKAMQMLEDKV